MQADLRINNIQEINWDEFLSSIDTDAPHLINLHIPPNTLERKPTHIREILLSVQKRQWVIPNFQRYYDWDPDDVKDLLTSIVLEYYIGSLLLWDPKESEKLDCMPVHGVNGELDNKSNQMIVLDGQQRITSLNYVINPPITKNKDTDKKFPGYYYMDLRAFLDGSEDLIIHLHIKLDDNDTFKFFLFPFYKLRDEDINKWIADFQKQFSDYSTVDQLKICEIGGKISNKLFRILGQFEIPRVELPNTVEFDSVAAIFENLNSKGKSLGTFDLLIVRLSRYNVQLKKLWDDTLEEHNKIQEYFEVKPKMTKLGLYIIESISLAFTKSKSCKRKDILNLFIKNNENVESFSEKWKEMSKYTQRAIVYLEEELGILSKKDLPYEPIIPILAAALREIDLNFSAVQPSCIEKLHYWYWTSVFDTRFSAGVDGKKSSDFTDLVQWFKDESKIPTYIKNFRNDYKSKLHLKDIRRRGSSVYLGMFSLLTKNGATDLQRNLIMDKKSPHMDHIFPKSKYKHHDGLQNTIINMTWLTKDTNIKDKRDRLPSDYISEIISKTYQNNNTKFIETLACHFINEKCLEHLKKDDFEKFLDERERIMLDRIGMVIGAVPSKSL